MAADMDQFSEAPAEITVAAGTGRYADALRHVSAEMPMNESDTGRICDAVITLVSAKMGVERDAVLAKAKGSKTVLRARQIAMYLTHVEFSISTEKVGKHFSKDRTTVGYACRRIEDLRDLKRFDCNLDDWARELGAPRFMGCDA